MEAVSIFSVTILCRDCGAAGLITWEKVRQRRSFVSLSDNFHERISRHPPYALELVCNACGNPQLEEE